MPPPVISLSPTILSSRLSLFLQPPAALRRVLLPQLRLAQPPSRSPVAELTPFPQPQNEGHRQERQGHGPPLVDASALGPPSRRMDWPLGCRCARRKRAVGHLSWVTCVRRDAVCSHCPVQSPGAGGEICWCFCLHRTNDDSFVFTSRNQCV